MESWHVIFLTIGAVAAGVAIIVPIVNGILSSYKMSTKDSIEKIKENISDIEAEIVGAGNCKIKHEEIDRRFKAMEAIIENNRMMFAEAVNLIHEDIRRNFVETGERINTLKDMVHTNNAKVEGLKGNVEGLKNQITALLLEIRDKAMRDFKE